MNKSKLFFEVLRLPVDFAVTFLALLLAYKIRPITDLIPGAHYSFFPEYLPPFSQYLQFSLWASGLLLVLFMLNGLYSLKFSQGFGRTSLKIMFLVTVWVLFILAYYFLIRHELFFSRLALGYIWIFSILFLVMGRGFIFLIKHALYRRGVGQINLLFIGNNTFAQNAFLALIKDKKYHILGAVEENFSASSFPKSSENSLLTIGNIKNLERLTKKYAVEEIIQAESNLKSVSSAELLAFCRAKQIHYYVIPEVLQLQTVNVGVEMIDGIPLISLKQTRLEGWGKVYKRIFDFLGASVLILLLLPLWIIVSILVKLDSKGPVFYKSYRKYKDKVFPLYKFRSMVVDADQQKAKLLAKNERKGPLFKIKDDPRVTRLGRFLRKTSIDELPQLFNVLLGHMSLVGPRPHLPEEVEQYETHHLGVFAIKPGITGLAQINGRSNLDFEEEVKLDFYYMENWSMWLDVKILFQTVGVVFKADGH